MKPAYGYAALLPDGRILFDSSIRTESGYLAIVPSEQSAQIVRVKIQESQKASLDARALFHVWCQQLSGFTGEDPNGTKQGLKIKFGFPILLADRDDGPMLQKIFSAVQWPALSWEEKKKVAERYIPCTSIMSKKQLKQFMDNIKAWAQNEYNVTLDNGKR